MGIRWVLFFVVLALVLLLPGNAWAQSPWLPGEGQAVFQITYQWLDANNHLMSSAVEGPELTPFEQWLGFDMPSKVDPDSGTSQSMAVVLDADIGITDRLALFGGLAWIAPRYLGPYPYVGIEGDDGNFHGTFQDARIGARYAVVRDGTWTVTPFTSFIFPTHNYEVIGHSAPGLGLKELQLGGSAGRFFDIGSQRLWFQGSYWYSIVENVSDEIKLDRSSAIFDVGWFATRRLTVNFLTTWQKVHGGIEWANMTHPELSFDEIWAHSHLSPDFHQHDRAAATRDWNFGGGASFQVSEAVEVYANINTMLWGENTHEAMTFNFGVNFGFQAWGGGGLGMWESHEDENADLDDWLLEEFDEPSEPGNDEGKKKQKDEESS